MKAFVVILTIGFSIGWARELAAQSPAMHATTRFPSNYSIYGVNLREHEVRTTAFGQGVYKTCDSGEVIIGTFCEEKVNDDPDPNAILTAGSATARSGACRWKNRGLYRVVASCLAITAIKGDSGQGIYSINQTLD
jgi:hypothetical protein